MERVKLEKAEVHYSDRDYNIIICMNGYSSTTVGLKKRDLYTLKHLIDKEIELIEKVF